MNDSTAWVTHKMWDRMRASLPNANPHNRWVLNPGDYVDLVAMFEDWGITSFALEEVARNQPRPLLNLPVRLDPQRPRGTFGLEMP